MDINQYGGKEIEAKYYKYKAKYLRSKFGAGALMHGGADEQLTAASLTQLLKKTPQNTSPIVLETGHKYILFIDLARYFSNIKINESKSASGDITLSIDGKPSMEISKIVDHVFKFRPDESITSLYINSNHKYDFLYDLGSIVKPSAENVIVPDKKNLRLVCDPDVDILREKLFSFFPSYFKEVLTDDINNRLVVFEQGGILTDKDNSSLKPLNSLSLISLIEETTIDANKTILKDAMEFINNNKLGRIDCAVIFETEGDRAISKIRQCYLLDKPTMTCELRFANEADLISFIKATKDKVKSIESQSIVAPPPVVKEEQEQLPISSGGRRTNYLFF